MVELYDYVFFSVFKLDEIFGKLVLPTESTIILTTDRFNLTGVDGIWSHSLVLTSGGERTCATIDVSLISMYELLAQKVIHGMC